MSWYLASYADNGTHRGTGVAVGEVRALCGITFKPLRLPFSGARALTGQPHDPDQICPKCLCKVSAQ